MELELPFLSCQMFSFGMAPFELLLGCLSNIPVAKENSLCWVFSLYNHPDTSHVPMAVRGYSVVSSPAVLGTPTELLEV